MALLIQIAFLISARKTWPSFVICKYILRANMAITKLYFAFHLLFRSLFYSFIIAPQSVRPFFRLVISYIQKLVHLFVRSFVRSFVRPFVPSFVCAFVRSFVRWCVLSCVRSLIRPSVHYSFVRSFDYFLPLLGGQFLSSLVCFIVNV